VAADFLLHPPEQLRFRVLKLMIFIFVAGFCCRILLDFELLQLSCSLWLLLSPLLLVALAFRLDNQPSSVTGTTIALVRIVNSDYRLFPFLNAF
jgi:hypothetical protein